ncbi:MAG: hypothetical protein GAK31_02137 [Stenotrophomonas maltophilia]|uniref:DUF3829 domain-containing protein n=1 Tax=Stenotrophomonas maltophilia TaxID=40324 RepID=A0A7V8FFL1_STEMA|nr:MAG: hypothetical protein GAK31_02137 [Stenotrophomonas maltophilia]
MKQFLSTTALAVAIALSLSACGGKGGSTADGAKDAPASAQAEDAQQALTAKLNDYIDCYNAMDADIQRDFALYVGWMKDPKAGPSGRETRGYGPNPVDGYRLKKCEESVTRALAAAPALPELDEAAKQYLAELKTLQPLSKQAHDYYSREDFEDDGFALGKQLHAPLMAAMASFTTASDAFSDALEARNDALQRERLAALEKAEGRSMEFFRLSMMLEAKALVDLMSEDSFDAAAGAERVAAFNAISDEAHAKVKPADNDTKWSTFEMSAEQFRRAGKERLARVRDRTTYSKLEQGWLDNPTLAPSGSPGKLLKAYNDLVQRSNLL